MSTTDYDAIGDDYKRAKLQPWRSHVEAYTLLGLIGDVAGLASVDLACGEGFYTRLLRRRGASPVLGVDLSAHMIELARAEEAERPLGIAYQVGDGRGLDVGGSFDLAMAAYLLNYARDRGELAAMCRSVAGCLRPGGRFVAANSDPGVDLRVLPSYRRYGLEVSTDEEGTLKEGAAYTWTFHLEGGAVRVENYAMGRGAIEEALREAGFTGVRWHAPRLSPEAEAADGRAFWADLLDRPPIAFLEAVK